MSLVDDVLRKACSLLKASARRLRTKLGKCEQISTNSGSPLALACEWLRRNELPTGGIRAETGHPHAYPEVTGYLVPTLLQYRQTSFAHRLLRWLCAIQRSDGSFVDPDTAQPHAFDTGQILRGLLAGRDFSSSVEEAAYRATTWLDSQLISDGKQGYGKRYQMAIPESVHLYTLPPLLEAARLFHIPGLEAKVFAAADFYTSLPDALNPDTLTHFLAYELEGLLDLGLIGKALPVLEKLLLRQRKDGSIPGMGNCNWVCSPGLAQLSSCLFKTGRIAAGKSALTWLSRRQNDSGGFFGSYGDKAGYKEQVEIPWAVKFFLDAQGQLATTEPAVAESVFSTHISSQISEAERRSTKHVLTLAPPGAPVSEWLIHLFPQAQMEMWTDIDSIFKPDHRFDLAILCDQPAVECQPELWAGTCAELLVPGGTLLLLPHRGFPAAVGSDENRVFGTIINAFKNCGFSVEDTKSKGLDVSPVLWAKAPMRLSGNEWANLLVSPEKTRQTIDHCRFGFFSEWGLELFRLTKVAEKVLEIGSGTGEISLQLAQAGREVTCMDVSQQSLDHIVECSKQLNIPISVLSQNAELPVPGWAQQFDCVWSSGLVEHFGYFERVQLLSLWGTYSRNLVVTFVPNGFSLPYLLGKHEQTKRGTWAYGSEFPLTTLKREYEEAGIEVLEERTISPTHSIQFLSDMPELCRLLHEFFAVLPDQNLQDLKQGYLLVTVGRVKSANT